MKTRTQKRTTPKNLVLALVKTAIAIAAGMIISTATMMGTDGVFLPAMSAFLAPVWGVLSFFGGAAALTWDGISVSDMAFLAASLICLPLRLMYNAKDKHKYPAAAGVVCGFTALSGSIAACVTVGADISEYASGILTAVLCGGVVFVFARLSFSVIRGKNGLIERDRLALAAMFGVAALSSWEFLCFNFGIAVYIIFCCCALHCLKKHEAVAFCAAVAVGFVVSGVGIGVMGVVIAAVLAKPVSVSKSRRLSAIYLLSAVMLISLCMGETEWLRNTVSTLIGAGAFCLMPEKTIPFFIGVRKRSTAKLSKNEVSGKGTFLSAELERLAARVSLAQSSSYINVEDAVYAGVCVNCERHGECFSENTDAAAELYCIHFDKVMSSASHARKSIDICKQEESRALERRKQFSGVLTAASHAAREAYGSTGEGAERIKEALEEAGSGCREVYFAEDGSCELYYPTCERIGERRISAAFGGLSGSHLSFGERCESGGVTRLTYLPTRRFKIKTSSADIAKEESGICGDGVRFFEKGVYYYALLSDGMGTGDLAGNYSSFLLESLEGLIRAGYSPETAVLLASEGLRCSVSDEGFATLNMARFNLVNGQIDFYSCGEGRSFLSENGSIKEIPGGGYPLGLMDEPVISHKTVEATNSNLLIMLTDGGSNLSAMDISMVLNELGDDILSELAETVCGRAYMRQTDKNRDDVTVVAVSMEKL